MSNQISSVGFGTDCTVMAGYASSAGNLGNIDLMLENTGSNALYFRLMQYDGTTSPSGFAQVGPWVTVVPGGTATQSYVLLNKRVGFFGSGSTTANITANVRNKADLRGIQLDLVATGRRGWSIDDGFAKAELKKKWGTPSGPASTSSNHDAGQGIIDTTTDPRAQ